MTMVADTIESGAIMKSVICITLFAFLVMAIQATALAVTSDSMRCGGGLISVGDVASDVVGKCGQPTYATQREEKLVDEFVPGERTITTIIIDDWTFNFGPDRLQYRVLLRNGKVWQIDSLFYGY